MFMPSQCYNRQLSTLLVFDPDDLIFYKMGPVAGVLYYSLPGT
jgi:hypothetical protein